MIARGRRVARAALAPVAYWPRAWRLVWDATSWQTALWLGLIVVQGLLPLILVFLTKRLVDGVVSAMQAGANWETATPVLLLLALVGGVMLATEVVQSVSEWVRTSQAEHVQDHIRDLIQQQTASLDMALYEQPAFHDQLERARGDAATRPLALLESMSSLLQSAITLVAMALILVPLGPWLPLLLLFSTAPSLVVALRFDARYHRWWEATVGERRRAQYYDLLLSSPLVAPEIRVFNLGTHFRMLYRAVRGRLRSERLQMLRSQSLARLGAGAVALVILALGLGWMIWRALQGSATLGDLALFYQAFAMGQGLARTSLTNLGQVYSNSLFLRGLFELLDLRPAIADAPATVPAPSRLAQSIRFRDVTFRYPGADRDVLRDFNLHIPAGKVVAIVGPNGAGKSSLLKLLCRFYDPAEGCVELDGVDVRRLRLAELWRSITVLFQFPTGYYLTARDNISLGDVQRADAQAEIELAAGRAGARELIERLPHRYKTVLGKVLDSGVELSGGEWQRIATARAYFRDAPLILLDEPTSFMDSWAEAEWFEQFRDLASGRTAIVITHRFTIAMRADVIHVMDAGQIVESGTHAELLANDGAYARSWTTQMRAGAGVAEPVA